MKIHRKGKYLIQPWRYYSDFVNNKVHWTNSKTYARAKQNHSNLNNHTGTTNKITFRNGVVERSYLRKTKKRMVADGSVFYMICNLSCIQSLDFYQIKGSLRLVLKESNYYEYYQSQTINWKDQNYLASLCIRH